MNSVNIVGRIGGDIELRYTPGGKSVAELNLAVDDGFGENKKTAWIGVVLWGATAETAAKYLSKGNRVGITGRLSQDEWTDKATGKQQRKTKVICDQLTFVEAKKDGAQTSQSTQKMHGSEARTAPQPRQPEPENQDFEEIPF